MKRFLITLILSGSALAENRADNIGRIQEAELRTARMQHREVSQVQPEYVVTPDVARLNHEAHVRAINNLVVPATVSSATEKLFSQSAQVTKQPSR